MRVVFTVLGRFFLGGVFVFFMCVSFFVCFELALENLFQSAPAMSGGSDKHEGHSGASFVAGGLSGMVAKTAVAPIERVKILYQVVVG